MSLTSISCTATSGDTVSSTLTTKTPPQPSAVCRKETSTGNCSRAIHVQIDANNTTSPTLAVDSTGKKFYVQYSETEEIPSKLTTWSISASFASTQLKLKDTITVYNQDTDPITSRGTTTTVQPPM